MAAAQQEDGAYLVVLRPTLDVAWTPPPGVSACFDAGVGQAMAERYRPYWGETMSFRAGLRSWSDVASVGFRRWTRSDLDLVYELFDACAVAAGVAGAAPSVRHEVRVRRGRDGEPAVSLAADGGPGLDDRLRCCLKVTGASLVPTLHPGDELRFDGGPHGRGVTLVLWTMAGEPLVARRWP